jgi:primosomal protein N'
LSAEKNFDTENLIAEVLIPRPVYGSYSYAVPAELRSLVFVGSRVRVDFGHQSLIGLVKSLKSFSEADLNPELELRPVSGIFEPFPFVDGAGLSLAEWISNYYFESPGEVAALFYPRYTPVQEQRFSFQVAEPDELIKDIPSSRKVLRTKLHNSCSALVSTPVFDRNTFMAASSMTDSMFAQCLKEGFLCRVPSFDSELENISFQDTGVFARAKKKLYFLSA